MKLRAVVLPLFLLYPLYAGVMYAKQLAILFPAASDHHHAFAGPLPANAELVEIPASFGKVRAIFLVPPVGTAAAPAIVFAHGNFERVQDSYPIFKNLVDSGIAVLQLEFPGYDGADGKPGYASINEAENLAYDWLAKQAQVDPQRIISMGYSIGGGPACELARNRHTRGLILLSTYSSIVDIAHHYLLPAFVVRVPWDNTTCERDYAGPVLIEHGRHDEVIPYELGMRNVAAAGDRGEFVPLDCGHADCHFDRTIFAERLPAWMRKHGLLDAKNPNSDDSGPTNSGF
ncbi:alpha/beta hydrolase [Pseudolysobacter antarcticus]|uniref:Alpha/beta hydrolase n=1 Tax=Pseudolysobacter antarcticus TaxID=2511995 RepID=A0A411HFM7_9GAMM|nr:alpha/beta fold hydrolase [Pseudolysobacter antarcticus]QBB69288.1 alpha/beta hydrolase [Pseudolysobacter antarcticus]